MMKTISAVLLAVSVLAAPALAATSVKPTPAPVVKSETVKQGKTNVLNANARMGHHNRHFRHHRFHVRTGALRTHHDYSKVTVKHVAPATKRG